MMKKYTRGAGLLAIFFTTTALIFPASAADVTTRDAPAASEDPVERTDLNYTGIHTKSSEAADASGNASRYGGALSVTGGQATLKNVSFTNNELYKDENNTHLRSLYGGAAAFRYVSNLTFEGAAAFVGNLISLNADAGNGEALYGGALYVESSSSANGALNFDALNFKQNGISGENTRDMIGGAVYIEAADIVFNGSLDFTDNYIKGSGEDAAGGAMFVRTNSNGDGIHFKDAATFNGNYVDVKGGGISGGALYVNAYNSKFMFDKALSFNGNYIAADTGEVIGGAAYFEGVGVFADTLDFTDNYMRFDGGDLAAGGALSLSGYFESSNGSQSLDGIYFQNKVTAVNNAIFVNASMAVGGGAVLVGQNAKISLTDADFIENHIDAVNGSAFGGALAVVNTADSSFNGTTLFRKNYVTAENSKVYGSALYVDGSENKSDGSLPTLSFNKATFQKNYVNATGDASDVYGGVFASLPTFMTDSCGSSANPSCSAISVLFNGDTVFNENSVTATDLGGVSGGVIYVANNAYGANDAKVSFNGAVSFNGNTVQTDGGDVVGGVVHAAGTTHQNLTAPDTVIEFNGAASFTNNTVSVNYADPVGGNSGYLTVWGAALYAGDGSSVTFAEKPTFIGNRIEVSRNGNAELAGAGVFIESYAYFPILTFNKGAVFNENVISADMSEGNFAAGGAGMLMIVDSYETNGNFTFYKNGVSLNTASNGDTGVYGGGWYLSGNDDTKKLVFNGAVTLDQNFIDISSSASPFSSDGFLGGGMWIGGKAFFNGETTFTGNYISVNGEGAEDVASSIKGGALYLQFSDVTFASDTLFRGNYVSINGVKESNAIYASESAIAITAGAGKAFTDYDGIDGENYSVKITGDGAMNLYGGMRGTDAVFEKTGAGTLTLQVNSSLAQGAGRAALDVKDLTISAGDLSFTTSGALTLNGNYLMMRSSGTFTLSDALLALNGTTYTTDTGYTFEYVIDETGKTLSLTVTDYMPPPVEPSRPAEEEKNFVNSAKSLVVADVRAGMVQITDRLSSLGATMNVAPASPTPGAATSDRGRSGGDAGTGEATLWAKALYTATDLRGDTRMNSDGYGFIVGADGAVSGNMYLGAALGYTRNQGDTEMSHFKSQTFLGYLYGHYGLTDNVAVAGTVGYGFTRFDLDAADKKFNAHTINAQGTVDYALVANLTVGVGGRYTFSAMDAYRTGTTDVAAEDTHTATALAGLRYRQNFGGLVVKASAGVLYDVYSEAADYRLTQSGMASYAKGECLHRFGGEGGIGVGYEGDAFGIEADYNAQVRQDYHDQTVSVKLVYRFGGAQKAKKNTGAKVFVPAAPGGARGTTLQGKSQSAPGGARGTTLQRKSQSAPVKRLQVSSFKKEQNARKQYRTLSRKYPELRAKQPEYKRVNVKGKGKRVRTYVKGKDEELQTLCKKMHGDLKDTCLIKKGK